MDRLEAEPEVFFCRVPGSSFAGQKSNIVFSPDPNNQSVGRYETSDAAEIADLKAAIKSGAPTLFQDAAAKPYAKSADPKEAEEQRRAIEEEERKLRDKQLTEAERLRQLNNLGAGVGAASPLVQQQVEQEVGKAAELPKEGTQDTSIQRAQETMSGGASGTVQNQTQGVGGIVNTTSLASSGNVPNTSQSAVERARAAIANQNANHNGVNK